MALAASCVTLFYCLFFFQGYQKLFRDSDAGWHIRAGDTILATGQLPRIDPYSFTRAGSPWFAWEWGADVLMSAVHTAAGLSGVAMLYGLAIAAGVWLWFRLHWLAGGNFLIACAMAPLLLSTCNIHWLARPHVLSWLLMLAAVIYTEKAAQASANNLWQLLPVAGVAALWANLHASFFLAPLLALLYALAFALRPLVWDLDRAAEWQKSRWLLCAGAVAAAAGLLNPYGWNLHRHVFSYLADSDLLARIGEFQSFDFHADGAAQILTALGVAALGGAAALGQKKLAHFFLAALLTASALRSARALPLVALLVLPLANGAITGALEDCATLQRRLRLKLDGFLRYSARLRALDSRFNGLALAPFLAMAFFGLLRLPAVASRTGFPPDQFPVAAAAEVEKLPAEARLLAPDKFGGYLIYRFAGKRKVFFDGRSDLYGADFLKQYALLVQVRPGWHQQFDSLHFTHALLPHDYSLIPALEQIGWKRLYGDGTATLLVRGTY